MRKVIVFTSILLGTCISVVAQKIGIGTTSPSARLEVRGEGNTSTTNTLLLKNSLGDTLLRMRDNGHMNLGYNGIISGRPLNIGGIGINLFSDDVNLGGAIFPTDTSMILWSNSNDNNYVILQPSWGEVGIGTYSPKSKFHVRNGVSNAVPHSTAAATFEDNTDVSINILSPSSSSSAIYFGNPLSPVHGGIVYNSTVENGLAFRTNGNVNRAVINNVGDMGIGEFTPDARLHISDGVGGNQYNPAAELIIEDNSSCYVQFSNIAGGEAGILSGNDLTFARSGIIFRPDSSVQIRAGGTSTRMLINNNGNIGIGTATPAARLDVSGPFILGINGTPVTEMIKLTVLSDVPNIAANDSEIELIPVANCVMTSSVLVSPSLPLADGLIIAYARVSVNGTVEVKFTNTTPLPINPNPMNFFITVIR